MLGRKCLLEECDVRLSHFVVYLKARIWAFVDVYLSWNLVLSYCYFEHFSIHTFKYMKSISCEIV